MNMEKYDTTRVDANRLVARVIIFSVGGGGKGIGRWVRGPLKSAVQN